MRTFMGHSAPFRDERRILDGQIAGHPISRWLVGQGLLARSARLGARNVQDISPATWMVPSLDSWMGACNRGLQFARISSGLANGYRHRHRAVDRPSAAAGRDGDRFV